MFQHTELLHVKKSKEDVKQSLLEFKFDIQIYRYHGEEVAEDRIILIPKATEFMGGNSFMPVVNCFLTYGEDGTDIKLLFELNKWAGMFMPILSKGFLLMEIAVFMAGLVPVGLAFVAGLGLIMLLGDRSFSKSAQRIIKKIMEVLEESKNDEG